MFNTHETHMTDEERSQLIDRTADEILSENMPAFLELAK